MKRKQLNRKYQGWIDKVTSRSQNPKAVYWYYRYWSNGEMKSLRIREDALDFLRFKLHDERYTIHQIISLLDYWYYYPLTVSYKASHQ